MSSLPQRPTCGTCPYWLQTSIDTVPIGYRQGECRRLPPSNIDGRWPETTEGAGHDGIPSFTEKSEEERQRYADENAAEDQSPEQREYWGWCGEHPDFPAYIASRRQRQEAAR